MSEKELLKIADATWKRWCLDHPGSNLVENEIPRYFWDGNELCVVYMEDYTIHLKYDEHNNVSTAMSRKKGVILPL